MMPSKSSLVPQRARAQIILNKVNFHTSLRTRQMNILRLPTEIIVDILLSLDVPDAYAVQALNRFFHNLYKTSLQLQYALECKIAQVRDNPNCHLPIPERLQMLRDRESAWSSLTPTSKRTIKLPTTSVENVTRSCSLGMQPNHCILHRLIGSNALTFRRDFQISPFREIKESSFHPIQVENIMHAGYCIDEHDLIVCLTRVYPVPDSQIELRLVMLQYSTGNAHPLAMEPYIPVHIDVLSNMLFKFSIGIAIFGENLVLTIGVIFNEKLGWMHVYNWKTGKAKCEPIRVSNTDIVVLDHNLVIIPDINEYALYIFHIPSSSSGGPVNLIQRLGLPLLKSPRTFWVGCQSLPNPTGDGQFPKHVSSSIPFMDRPDTALIRIILPNPVSVLVHRHSIMKLLPPSRDWTTVMKQSPILHWNSWGPPVAAIVNRDVIMMYGQRVLQRSDSGMSIYHFNAYHARRQSKANGPYKAGVVSPRLPHVEIVSLNEEFSATHIADGAAIQLKASLSLIDRHFADAPSKADSNTIEVLYFGQ